MIIILKDKSTDFAKHTYLLIDLADIYNTSTDYILGRTDNPTFRK